MRNLYLTLATIIIGVAMSACNGSKQSVNIKCDTYTLPNGLRVVLQQDHSDPIVAVAIQYHVGSAREKRGKTGFAHFFEHMLFQRSENLPRNAFFQKISALGGDFNGGTNSDGTSYYESVPRDALEKVLWMESDRMGYFINTVTQGGLEREIDVVSNEKRQNYDTRPYGQLIPIFSKYAFPEGHPYSWTTIGELDDLRAATVDDVKEFYKNYYKPNNATLVISGDFDPAQTKALVEKYFGEIASGETVKPMEKMPVPMDQTVKVFHEDAYASMPMLTIVFPGVAQYDKDYYTLDMLTSVLGEGKNSPLYKVIVDQKKLAPSASIYTYSRELAGNIMVSVPAFAGVDLDQVRAAVQEAFDMFEAEGFDEKVMDGFKALNEVGFYNRISGVMGRALMLAHDDVFAGDPLYGFKENALYNAVTKDEVLAAFDKYIKGKNALEISIVPKGSENLAIEGSQRAVISEENISDQSMKSGEGALVDDDYQYTPSAIDRSVEPALLSNTPTLNPPVIWKEQLADGLKVWGATNDEMPLVRFSLMINGGMLADSPDKVGVASLYASTMLSGTQDKTPEELEEAFKRLGANVSCYAGTEAITIYGTCLSRNLKGTVDLITEVLTKPRFDGNEFAKARQRNLASITQQQDDAATIANVAMRKVIYGADNILSHQTIGEAASVEAVTIDDLKAFHTAFVSPAAADMNLAGNINAAEARKALESLSSQWTAAAPSAIPAVAQPAAPASPRLYFIDQPGAQQSYILVACPAMPLSSPDYYPAYIANFQLGDGSHALLFNELRLKRGYTYGAYSSLRCGNESNMFMISTKVQGIKTKESVDVIREILETYGPQFTAEEMETVRGSIQKATFGAYETLGSLANMLADISFYGLPEDYVKRQEGVLSAFTADKLREMAAKYMNPAAMTYVVVGDAASQLPRLKDSGMGQWVMLDKQGNEIKQ